MVYPLKSAPVETRRLAVSKLDKQIEQLEAEMHGIECELEELRDKRNAEWRKLHPRDPNKPLSITERIYAEAMKKRVQEPILSRLVKR